MWIALARDTHTGLKLARTYCTEQALYTTRRVQDRDLSLQVGYKKYSKGRKGRPSPGPGRWRRAAVVPPLLAASGSARASCSRASPPRSVPPGVNVVGTRERGHRHTATARCPQGRRSLSAWERIRARRDARARDAQALGGMSMKARHDMTAGE
jgi:hypothetical protein